MPIMPTSGVSKKTGLEILRNDDVYLSLNIESISGRVP